MPIPVMIVVLTLGALALVVLYLFERIRELSGANQELHRSLDEIDEQAKLIVRTDMELNKAQEELDKKINGLYALQKLSRAISTSLEEAQIFGMIKPEHLEDFGFERACALLWDEPARRFQLTLGLGYSKEELTGTMGFIDSHKEAYTAFIREAKTSSSLNNAFTQLPGEAITKSWGVTSFVCAPLLPKEGSKGFLFVGTNNPDSLVTEGDEEVITILAHQLGQALENARLFEKTWRAQQGLEKKVEERTHELSRALEEIRNVSRRKNDFISSVSHELRTPLTSIKGYAAILLAGTLGDLPPEVHERLEKINRHSDELVHFINDLLDISRIESGRGAPQKEVIDVRGIFAKIADLLAPQLKEAGITLNSQIEESAATVTADRNQLERIFINLIGNAIKFTPRGGSITVRALAAGHELQFDVADTGCGIPLEVQDKIFEEFYRVDNNVNQTTKGTGLGLTLVKRIVEAHGGKIRVASSPGSGATFSVTLPRAT